MRFGINTFLWTKTFSASDLGLIEHVRSLGAEGIEFARYGFNGFPVEAIRAELDRLGMGCTLCTAPYEPELSIIHPSVDARRDGLNYLREAIGVASRLGASALTGPLYAKVDWFSGSRRTTAEWDWAVAAFQALGPDLDRAGITLALEPMNRWEAYFLNTVAEGVALCEAIGHPRIGLLLDTVHMAIEEKSQGERHKRRRQMAAALARGRDRPRYAWDGADRLARRVRGVARHRVRRLVHDRELRLGQARDCRADPLLAGPGRIAGGAVP